MDTFSALLALCAGNSPVTGEFPTQKASDAELWCILWSALYVYSWVNNHGAGDLGRHRAHYTVIVMTSGVKNSSAAKCIRQIAVSAAVVVSIHQSDVTWASWRLKSPATRLSVELFVIKKNIKARFTTLEIRWWQMGSPHKGPITRKVFACDDVIMPEKTQQGPLLSKLWQILIVFPCDDVAMSKKNSNNLSSQSQTNFMISYAPFCIFSWYPLSKTFVS